MSSSGLQMSLSCFHRCALWSDSRVLRLYPSTSSRKAAEMNCRDSRVRVGGFQSHDCRVTGSGFRLSDHILLELNLSTLYLRQQRAFAQFVDSNKQGTESSGLMSYFVSDSRLGRSVQDVIFSYHSVSRAAVVCFQLLFLGSVGN